KIRLSFLVIEKFSSLRVTKAEIEIVLHDEHDVNIIRLRFGRDKAAEDNHSCELARRFDKIIDMPQPHNHILPLSCSRREACEDFAKSGPIYSFGQVPFVIEGRKRHISSFKLLSSRFRVCC